jgi:amidase
MLRREFLKQAALASLALPGLAHVGCSTPNRPRTSRVRPFELEEFTVTDLRAGLESGEFTSASLAEKYLARINAVDRTGPRLNSVIELNTEAPAIARKLDQERRSGRVRGPLHGIPVLLKDNIDTADGMMTTAGSLALEGHHPKRDSTVAARLRAAGAVILGKTNLSEWANFRSTRSTSGWSGRGGQTNNPYVLARNPSGSSSGSGAAVSANLCAVAVGTETDGSILSPSSCCGIVGIKPTLGLIGRSGIIPIAHSQDTAGPMARTVADAATLLGVLAGVDDRDEATADADEKGHRDYTQFLEIDGLAGSRIGVARRFFGNHAEVDALAEAALDILRERGATIVDPADLPTHGQFGRWEWQVMLYEFKHDLDAYLANVAPELPVHSLAELIGFNRREADRELSVFGQEILIMANDMGPLTDSAYREALTYSKRLSGTEGIDAIMNAHRLDALVAPTTGPAHFTDHVHGDRRLGGSTAPAAAAGYPSITVPMGEVMNLPVGLSFFGRAWSEPVLIRIAHAFEQATRHRIAPGFL